MTPGPPSSPNMTCFQAQISYYPTPPSSRVSILDICAGTCLKTSLQGPYTGCSRSAIKRVRGARALIASDIRAVIALVTLLLFCFVFFGKGSINQPPWQRHCAMRGSLLRRQASQHLLCRGVLCYLLIRHHRGLG